LVPGFRAHLVREQTSEIGAAMKRILIALAALSTLSACTTTPEQRSIQNQNKQLVAHWRSVVPDYSVANRPRPEPEPTPSIADQLSQLSPDQLDELAKEWREEDQAIDTRRIADDLDDINAKLGNR
jgi:hypothetical protein